MAALGRKSSRKDGRDSTSNEAPLTGEKVPNLHSWLMKPKTLNMVVRPGVTSEMVIGVEGGGLSKPTVELRQLEMV